MDGKHLVRILNALWENMTEDLWTYFTPGVHWTLPWRGGQLEVEVRETGNYRPSLTRLYGRKLDIHWHSPDPESEGRVGLWVEVTREEGTQIKRLSQLLQDRDLVCHRVPVAGSRQVSTGLSCLDGYWASPAPIPELETINRGSQQPRRSTATPRFVSLETVDLEPLLAGVPSIWTSDDEYLECCLQKLSDLLQYRCRRGPVYYRHPGDMWSETPPEGGVDCLWVHGLAELALIPQATQILIPIALMHPALIEAGRYHIQADREYYLLTRLPQAKSARSAILCAPESSGSESEPDDEIGGYGLFESEPSDEDMGYGLFE